MQLRSRHGHTPSIADDVFVAPSATVEGEVSMAPRSSVWFSSVVRADGAPVTLGHGVNVQDNSVVTSAPGHPTSIGDLSSLGHNATVEGAIIEDHVLIAISATVRRGCRIGTGSIIGANATVPEGTTIPPRSLVIGDAGRIARAVTDQEYERIRLTTEHYQELASDYLPVVGPPRLDVSH